MIARNLVHGSNPIKIQNEKLGIWIEHMSAHLNNCSQPMLNKIISGRRIQNLPSIIVFIAKNNSNHFVVSSFRWFSNYVVYKIRNDEMASVRKPIDCGWTKFAYVEYAIPAQLNRKPQLPCTSPSPVRRSKFIHLLDKFNGKRKKCFSASIYECTHIRFEQEHAFEFLIRPETSRIFHYLFISPINGIRCAHNIPYVQNLRGPGSCALQPIPYRTRSTPNISLSSSRDDFGFDAQPRNFIKIYSGRNIRVRTTIASKSSSHLSESPWP